MERLYITGNVSTDRSQSKQLWAHMRKAQNSRLSYKTAELAMLQPVVDWNQWQGISEYTCILAYSLSSITRNNKIG